MQIRAQIMSDEMRTYTDKKTNQPKTVRTLCLMDLDDVGPRMTKPVNVTIPLDDKVAGPAGQSDLKDAVVLASIEDISFLPWTVGQANRQPEIGFRVKLTSILGFQRLEAYQAPGKASK